MVNQIFLPLHSRNIVNTTSHVDELQPTEGTSISFIPILFPLSPLSVAKDVLIGDPNFYEAKANT